MTLSSRFEDALQYAAQIHSTQKRKGTQIPYVAHLLGVAGIALEYGATEDEAIGALLHDAAEDAGGRGRLDEVRQRFGPAVAAIVEGCTDTFETPKPDWETRKKNYLAHLSETSHSVLLVSASDKLHNARAILRDYRTHGEQLWPRFTGGKEGSLRYYRSLVNAYRKAADPAIKELVDELDRVVTEIETLAAR